MLIGTVHFSLNVLQLSESWMRKRLPSIPCQVRLETVVRVAGLGACGSN